MREAETIESFMHDAREFINELKNRQRVGGSNVLYYFTGSDSQYDVHVSSSTPLQYYLITFDFATTPGRALMSCRIFYRINNPDVLVTPIEPTATTPQVSILQDDVPPYQFGRFQVIMTVENNSFSGMFPTTYDVYMKLFFDGSDTGTWSIQAI